MATDASFLIPPSLHVAALLLGDDGVTIRAISEATTVCCPVCGEPAERVHSRYTRTLGDLPWARFAVHLHVEVRRFFCANPTCQRHALFQVRPQEAVARHRLGTLPVGERRQGSASAIAETPTWRAVACGRAG